MLKQTHGPVAKRPLKNLGFENIRSGVTQYSKSVDSNIIAMRWEANFRLPKRLSKILQKNAIFS